MYQLALQLVEVFFIKDYMVLLENRKRLFFTSSLCNCQTFDDNGIFISNCRHHVSHDKPAVWGTLEVFVLFARLQNIKCPLQVPVLDGELSERVTYKQAVANWLENRRPFQALDDPDITNSGCPF